MNQEQLVAIISNQTGINLKTTTKILKCILDTIIESVANGEFVTLIEFGKFEARYRRAKTIIFEKERFSCLRFQSKKIIKSIVSPEKVIPYFSPSKTGFRARVNGIKRPRIGGKKDWKSIVGKSVSNKSINNKNVNNEKRLKLQALKNAGLEL